MSSSPPTFLAPVQNAHPTKILFRAWAPVVGCLLVFALESTRLGGSDHTTNPLRHMAEALFGSNRLAYWEPIHHAIRKSGHFMGYGMFSLVCFRAFRMIQPKPARRLGDRLSAHGLAIAAAFLVASADEFHQTFLPNRTGCFSDVLLDTSGAVTLGLLLFIVTVIPPMAVAFFSPAPAPAPILAPTRREEDLTTPVHDKGPALV